MGGRGDPPQQRQGLSAVERVLCVPGLLTAPDHPGDISQGTVQAAHEGRDYLDRKVLSRVAALSFLLGWQEKVVMELSGLHRGRRLLQHYSE